MLRVRFPGSDGQVQERVFQSSPVRIGRDPTNEVVLDSGAVSRQHARLFFNTEEVSLVDASVNGTLVNGHPIEGYVMVGAGDEIVVGDVVIHVDLVGAEQRVGGPSVAESRADDPVLKLKRELHNTLLEHLDLKRLDIEALGEEEVFRQAKETLEDIIRAEQISVPAEIDRTMLVKEILDEALGLGPLEDFLKDDDITEIMVVSADLIYIERKGAITLTDKTFTSDDAIRAIIERIVTPLGRRIDESSPLVDARLKDGSRVNAVIPPLAIRGPCITIRKFRQNPLTMQDLIAFNTMTPQIARFLQRSVRGRKNVLVSGGTGSGKTTLLNVLSTFVPSKERIVTIEDSAELRLDQEHVVSLEARPPNVEGSGEVTIRDLVKNALRMRPDRIIVGECRGGEALDMLQAMNTGHDGSLTTGHSNSPTDMLARLETMVLMSGMELPVSAIRHQITSAIDLVVHQERMSDGSRRITHISEVTRLDDAGRYVVEDIFKFKREGLAADGTVEGDIVPTGYLPTFIPDLVAQGIIGDGEFLVAMESTAVLGVVLIAFVGILVLLVLLNGAWVTGRLDGFYDKYVGWVGRQLDDLYIDFSPRRFFWFHMIGVVLVFLAVTQFVGWIGGIVVAAAAYFIPSFLLKRARDKRIERFDQQLIDALQSMADSMRAGLVLTQAMQVVSDSMEAPISQEFRLMLKEHKLGLTLEDALAKMGNRLRSRFFDMVMTGILITRVHGGNVPQIFEDTSQAIREIFRLEEKIKTMTAQGKLQGYVIGLMPLAFAFAVYLIDPEYMSELFTDPKGYVIIFLILAFEAIGIFLIRRILAADI